MNPSSTSDPARRSGPAPGAVPAARPGAAAGPGPATREELLAAVEGLVFVSDDPITLSEMRQVLGVDEETLLDALAAVRAEHDRPGRGVHLEEVGGGLRFATRPEVAPFLRRLAKLRHRRRLSPGALETLAIVAYRQPVTSPEIEATRGVNPDAALSSLLEKRLIRVLGRKAVVGRPILYGTSKEFLVHFGINTLDDLPPIEDFERTFVPVTAEEAEGDTVLAAGGEEFAGEADPAGAAPFAGAGDDEEDRPDASSGGDRNGMRHPGEEE
jgi:segregation and condensation protein B